MIYFKNRNILKKIYTLKKKETPKKIGIPVWESKMKIKMTLRLHVDND